MMKRVSSLAPYEFRGGIKLAKGESDFDVDALKNDDKLFFDGLVKAEIVTFLPDAPKEPEKDGGGDDKAASGDVSTASPPPADDAKQPKKKQQ